MIRTRTASQMENAFVPQSAVKRTCTYPAAQSNAVDITPAKPPRDVLEDTAPTPRTPTQTRKMMNAELSATKPQREIDALKLVELKPFKLDAELFNSYLYRGKMIIPAFSAIARQDALSESPRFSLEKMESRIGFNSQSTLRGSNTPMPSASANSNAKASEFQTPIVGVPRLTRQQERLLLTAQQQHEQRLNAEKQAATPAAAGKASAVKPTGTATKAAATAAAPASTARGTTRGKATANPALRELKRIIECDEDLDSLLHDDGDDEGSTPAPSKKRQGPQRVLFKSPKNNRKGRQTGKNDEGSENDEDSSASNSDEEYEDEASYDEENECDEDDSFIDDNDVLTSTNVVSSPVDGDENDDRNSVRTATSLQYSARRMTRLQLQQLNESLSENGSRAAAPANHVRATPKDRSLMFGSLNLNASHLATPVTRTTSAPLESIQRTAKKEEKDKVVQVVVKYPLMGSWTEWKDSFQTCKDEVELYREIKTWRCPYLLRFYGTHGPGLVFEFVDGDSLDTLLDAEDVSTQTWRWSELGEHISTALYYLHLLNISHNDIKPENVRFSQSKGIWKLLDLGLATDMHALVCRNIGTDGYRAPEVAQKGTLHVKSDVYGLGVMMEEALICLQRRFLPLHKIFVGNGGAVPSFMLESEKTVNENDEEVEGPPKKMEDVVADAESFYKQVTKTAAYRAFTRHAEQSKTLEEYADMWDDLHAIMSDVVSKCLERNPDKRPSIKRLVHVFRAIKKHEFELEAALRTAIAATVEISKQR